MGASLLGKTQATALFAVCALLTVVQFYPRAVVAGAAPRMLLTKPPMFDVFKETRAAGRSLLQYSEQCTCLVVRNFCYSSISHVLQAMVDM